MKCIPDVGNLCVRFTVFTVTSCNCIISFFFLLTLNLSFYLCKFGIFLSSMSVKSWVQCVSRVFYAVHNKINT